MRFFLVFLLLFSVKTFAAGDIAKEGVYVLDKDKKILRSLTVNTDLIFDHVDVNGFEVYGPEGLKKFLERNQIPFIQLGVDIMETLDYPSPEQIEQKLVDLNRKFPHLTQLIEIGKSVKGRKLLVLKISDNAQEDEVEPEFKYISSMHGDEITGRELMVDLARDLLEGYSLSSEIQELVNSTEIYIMASMNPDGSAARQRANANYKDLNRNFPDFSTSNNQDSLIGKEPETQAIMSFQKQRNFALSVNFHGGAEVVNYAWDTIPDKHPFHDLLVKLSLGYANRVDYIKSSNEFPNGVTNGYAWYEVNGGMQDWSYYWHNDLQFTIELSQSKWPSYGQIPYYYAENKEALIAFIKDIHMGAGFNLEQPGISGKVIVSKIDGGSKKDLGTYNFKNSEFYKVLEPGQYSFEIKTGKDITTEIFVAVQKQAQAISPNYTVLKQ